jgi:Tfp pilus assembly protein PilF
MDLYFQGMAWSNRGLRHEYVTRAHDYFESALEVDPIDALVWMTFADAHLASAEGRATRFEPAEAAATKALSLAPEHAWAHVAF